MLKKSLHILQTLKVVEAESRQAALGESLFGTASAGSGSSDSCSYTSFFSLLSFSLTDKRGAPGAKKIEFLWLLFLCATVQLQCKREISFIPLPFEQNYKFRF
jgi:hypothetical protein